MIDRRRALMFALALPMATRSSALALTEELSPLLEIDVPDMEGLLLGARRVFESEMNALEIQVYWFDLTTITAPFRGYTALRNALAEVAEDVTLDDKDHPNYPDLDRRIEQARFFHTTRTGRPGIDVNLSVLQYGALVYVWRHEGPSRDTAWIEIERWFEAFDDDFMTTYTTDTIEQTLPRVDDLTTIFPKREDPGRLVEEDVTDYR